MLAGAAFVLAAQLRARFPGLALLLVSAVLVPFEVGGATGAGATVTAPLLVTAFLCGSALLDAFVVRRHVTLGASRLAVATLAFLAIAVIAFVVGQYPWFNTEPAPMRAQVGGLALFLLSGGLFLVVGQQVATLAQLQRLTWLFVGTGAVAIIASEISALDVTVRGIAITNASSIGSLFWTWLVAVGLSQALFNRDLSSMKRLALLAVAVLALARGLLLAFSWVSGWLPPLVAVGVILLLRFPRSVIGTALVLVAPALLLGGPVLDRFMAGESYSAMTRGEALAVMWRVIQRNPWLGFGPANYYHYTLLFPILGWWVRFNSHNNYVDLVGQTGVVGLLAFGWFVVEVIRLASRMRARVPWGFASAYVAGVLGGLAGSLVAGFLADWIVPFVYNIGVRGFRSSLLFWFFLGGLLALDRLTSPEHVPHAVRVGVSPGFEAARA